MNKERRAPNVVAHADRVLQRIDILNNAYLAALKGGSMSLDCFRKTQEQFFFAVTFFPRPMAALVGRIPNPTQRLDILRNLVEEHGEFDEKAFHHSTFQQFLRSIGSDPKTLDQLFVSPAVRAFNSVLTASCEIGRAHV